MTSLLIREYKVKLLMDRLIRALATVAFLADAGCYDAAFNLLETLDQIAMGLEMYLHPVYQVARTMLLNYIQRTAETPGKWHYHENPPG